MVSKWWILNNRIRNVGANPRVRPGGGEWEGKKQKEGRHGDLPLRTQTGN